MAEANINAEMARHLDEHGGRRPRRHERAIEIAEAVLLAVVAVLTAWSGYQASLWDAESAESYATSARERIEAEAAVPAQRPGPRLRRRHVQRVAAGDGQG